jgi:hypothetical protein
MEVFANSVSAPPGLSSHVRPSLAEGHTLSRWIILTGSRQSEHLEAAPVPLVAQDITAPLHGRRCSRLCQHGVPRQSQGLSGAPHRDPRRGVTRLPPNAGTGAAKNARFLLTSTSNAMAIAGAPASGDYWGNVNPVGRAPAMTRANASRGLPWPTTTGTACTNIARIFNTYGRV